MDNNYNIEFGSDDKGNFLKIKSNNSGNHYAVHRKFTKRMSNGLEINLPISNQIKDILINSISKKGVNEGLILFYDNEKKAYSIDSTIKKINPEDIRHQLTSKEVNYTSTGDKLNYHWPIFKKLNESNYGSIIRATLTLHQVCASKCQFCSTINRNRQDSISLDEAKEFVEKLYYQQADFNKKNFSEYNELYKEVTGSDIRLRSIILSGGGQPNLWPHFEDFVNWLSNLDLDIGLITNGFPKHVNDNIYNNFKWIRLSITPEDASPFYPEGKFNLQRIPNNIISNPDLTLGASYVYGSWTDDDILIRLNNVIDEWNLGYLRLLTDCNLGRSEQLMAHHNLAERLHKLNLIDKDGLSKGKIFHQLKYHGTPEEANLLWDEGKCFLQTYNVFWDTTGHEINKKSYCYPCDSVTVLAEEEATKNQAKRGFDGLTWGTFHNTDVEKLFTEEWSQHFDPRLHCSACLFMKNNRSVKNLMKIEEDQISLLTKNSAPEHVNFP